MKKKILGVAIMAAIAVTAGWNKAYHSHGCTSCAHN
jgi:hypothetical protein